jgi:hypothetical protein
MFGTIRVAVLRVSEAQVFASGNVSGFTPIIGFSDTRSIFPQGYFPIRWSSLTLHWL